MNRYLTLGALLAASFSASGAVLPLNANDLEVGERYHTFDHVAGIQAMGKDIGGRRRLKDSDWRQLKGDGLEPTVLSNWVIYDNPFYAMAAGTVVGCWRNAPENTPGTLHKDFVDKKFVGGGNHLWILQDDGVYALYAHAKTGSIPADICPNNAVLFSTPPGPGASPDIDPSVKVVGGVKVKAGQLLGRVGNSGASSGGPHLHVHMEKDGNPVPMKFWRGLTKSFSSGSAGFGNSWQKIGGNTLPAGTILFWPPRPIGNYTFKGTPAGEYQMFFDHMTDSGMMPDLITCKSSGATYDTTWVPSQGTWVSHAGMSAANAASNHKTYTSQGYKRTSSYTCGTVSAAVWRK